MKVLIQLLVATCFLSSTVAHAQYTRKTTTTKTTQKKKAPPAPAPAPEPEMAPLEEAPAAPVYHDTGAAYDPDHGKYDRNIADLAFIPNKGRVLITGGLAGVNTERTINQFNSKYATEKISGMGGAFGGLVGIFDGFAVGATGQYLNFTAKTDYTNILSQSGSTKSSGFTNPDLIAFWRALSMEQIGWFDVVVGAHYAPDLMKAKSATIYDDGTVAEGRPVYGFNAALYRKWSFIEGALSLKYDLGGDAEYESATTGNTTTVKQPDITTLGVEVQGMFTENLLGSAALRYKMRGAIERNYFDGTKSSDDASKDLVMEIGGKMIFLPNTSMLSASLNFGTTADYSGKDTTNNPLDFKDGSIFGWSVMYTHQF
jgi:hypothetical protein